MRILLVEDDSILGDGIVAGLKLGDYAVDWVRDGESARLALLDHPYDACVLDLGLPRRDGLSVLSDLRGRGSRLPVLILTARDTSADKVAGLVLAATGERAVALLEQVALNPHRDAGDEEDRAEQPVPLEQQHRADRDREDVDHEQDEAEGDPAADEADVLHHAAEQLS